MLVRIAALVAVDAPPVSYAFNLEAAGDLQIDPERVRGVLAAVAPIVGTARIASATSKIVRAVELELEVAELEAETEDKAQVKTGLSPSSEGDNPSRMVARRDRRLGLYAAGMHDALQGREGARLGRRLSRPLRHPLGRAHSAGQVLNCIASLRSHEFLSPAGWIYSASHKKGRDQCSPLLEPGTD